MSLFQRRSPGGLPRAEHWTDQAACARKAPGLFFPEDGGDAAPFLREQAKRICRGCPVRYECLRAALDRNERYGVWGGLDADERRRVRERERAREKRERRARQAAA